MQAIADKEQAGITIAPWDYRYYAEKVRKAKYDLDESAIKPYLQLEKLREGMFWVAGQLFGLQFSPVTGVPVAQGDVRVYEVKDAAGRHVGLWYFDPYARAGKQSGAWMNEYRVQERFDGEVPTIVSNNANFVKGQPGQPILVSWDDARTLFHEFGHALHGLCSKVSYPALSGTNVARDYVEFPSQLLEHWLATPEVLNRFARHVETGQPIPPELVAKIERASKFNQGFDTVEYLAAALVDMKLHLAGDAIAAWDYRYYAEKVRKAKYDLDEEAVKPYLQLEKLREAMFWVAGRLLDLHFAPEAGVPVYHPDVRVWEVRDGEGRHVGRWYFDPYARPGKRSGAWMAAYRRQQRLDGEVPTIVSNNANFVKGRPGEPVLVSWADAETLFHEFGHALHGLASSVTYPSLSGTAVARDFVEFPSQLLERWLATPEVLSRFARHVDTGEPIPRSLVEKIERASRFNQGFATVEYLSAALVDMRIHLAAGGRVDPAAFEREALAAMGMPREIVMRHRLPHFTHLFSGDAYSAGYYSYLWADTLSADAYEAFTEAGGPYNAAVAARLRRALSVGNTVDPADAYRAFRGRDPGIGALMRRRGFAEPSRPAARAP